MGNSTEETAPPHFYKDITVQLLQKEGCDEYMFAKMTNCSFQKLLDAKEWIVRRKGDMSWLPSDLVQLSNGVHLEAVRFGDEMKEMQGWRDHTVKATETQAAERAVARLIDLGGTDVERYCGPQRIMNPKSRKIEVEIDGAATCQQANLVVECKTHLCPKDVLEHSSRIDSLESLAKVSNIPELAQMNGKPFLGALAANTLPANSADLQQVLKKAGQVEIELWLPDGTGMGVGDSCVKSPHIHQPFQSGPAAITGPHKNQPIKSAPAVKPRAKQPSKRSKPTPPSSHSIRGLFSRGLMHAGL